MTSIVNRVAAVQMVSSPDVETNLAEAATLVGEAVSRGASLVLLPENFGIMSTRAADKIAAREPDGDGPQQAFLSRLAAVHGIHVIGGSVPLESGDPQRAYQSLLVYAPGGQRVARYDKMHLFRFEGRDERHDESRTLQGGDAPLALATPFGRLALSVCYDVRFPELYRSLGEFDAMFVPSAFTVPTGAAHWETLLRARAIENQAYVVAPAQGGLHPTGRRTHGHTMIVDPWGEVLAVRAEGEGIVLAEIDLERVRQVRAGLPANLNRRLH